jgi:hypothetical protein
MNCVYTVTDRSGLIRAALTLRHAYKHAEVHRKSHKLKSSLSYHSLSDKGHLHRTKSRPLSHTIRHMQMHKYLHSSKHIGTLTVIHTHTCVYPFTLNCRHMLDIHSHDIFMNDTFTHKHRHTFTFPQANCITHTIMKKYESSQMVYTPPQS